MMKPPTVEYGPSGSSRPVMSATSSRFTLPSTSTTPPTSRLFLAAGRVVLVADVADDLLDQVLEGDDAVGAAVLVDDDRQVLAFAAHLRQRDQHALGAGHAFDLARDVTDGAAAVGA